MNAPTSGTLQAPGANLYYEVRGTGPVLLLIPGGNGDADPYQQVADHLAGRRTVISYDRRGFSRSPLAEPPADQQRLEADSDDVRRLLDHLADGPAEVFGSSSGAIVALDLLARYPEPIRTLVAHEPPAVKLLPDATQHLQFFEEVYDTYRRLGVDPAMRKFNTGVGLDHLSQPPPGAELPPPVAQMLSRIHHNLEFSLEHELRQYPRVVPDLDALMAASARLVLAGGRESRGQLPYRPNTVLAERLGKRVVDFPGGHVGYLTHPADFAAQLADLLDAAATRPEVPPAKPR